MTDLQAAARHWRRHGYVLLPAHLTADEIAAGRTGLADVVPTAADFHADPGAERSARHRSPWHG